MTTNGARRAFLRSYHIPSILLHYPRLVRSMRRVAILDETAAAACIRDLKAGRRWSSYAVNRYGGTHKVATDAWKYRRVEDSFARIAELDRAFDSLMSRYEARIFALAFRITRNREDAQDVVQQSFHKAFLHLDTFQGRSAFSTWLTRIAINEALMCLRKNRALSEVSLEDIESETESLPTEIPDKGKSPAELYEQNEAKRILSRAISCLSLELRTAVLLRLEDRSIEEVAEILGVASGTLKARLFRAREKLRVLLAPGLEFRPKPSIAT